MVGPEIISYPITERHSHTLSLVDAASAEIPTEARGRWPNLHSSRRGALGFIQMEITTITVRNGRLHIIKVNRAGVGERSSPIPDPKRALAVVTFVYQG